MEDKIEETASYKKDGHCRDKGDRDVLDQGAPLHEDESDNERSEDRGDYKRDAKGLFTGVCQGVALRGALCNSDVASLPTE